jgi:hypothetical protein
MRASLAVLVAFTTLWIGSAQTYTISNFAGSFSSDAGPAIDAQ